MSLNSDHKPQDGSDARDRSTVMGLSISEARLEQIREAIGNEIRRRREDKNRSLQTIADKAGISMSYLSSIELGRHYPSLEILAGIARALGTTLAELLSVVDQFCTHTVVAAAPEEPCAPTWSEVIGDMVKAKRKLLGLSLKQLSDKSGLSAPHIFTIQKGAPASITAYYNLACALQIPIAKLMGRIDGHDVTAEEAARKEKPVTDPREGA